MTEQSRRIVVLLALAAVLSVAGAVAVIGSDVELVSSEPDADALVEEVIENHGGVETVQATRVSTYEMDHLETGTTTEETVEEIWMELPDRSRTEHVESDHDPIWDVQVVDGSTAKKYDTDEEAMLVDENRSADAITFHPERVDTEFDVAYVGTDTVDDRDTHVVELTPSTDEAAISVLVGETEYAISGSSNEAKNVTRTTTWWIDTEAGFPIKEQIESEYHDPDEHAVEHDRSVRTATYENVTFDEPIDDAQFTVDPPGQPDVYEPAQPFVVSTIEEADDRTPFDLQVPDVPDRFDVALVSASEFRGHVSADVFYRDASVNDGDEIRLFVTEESIEYETVLERDVGEHGGDLVETEAGIGYTWLCSGVRYELVVAVDDEDDGAFAVDLAESIDCQ